MSENINMGGEFYSAIIGEKSTGVYTGPGIKLTVIISDKCVGYWKSSK